LVKIRLELDAKEWFGMVYAIHVPAPQIDNEFRLTCTNMSAQ